MKKGDVVVWRIASDTADYVAEDMSGVGAKSTGGRWNRKGLPMIYTASTRALACLETVVHLRSNYLPLNRYLVEVTIPADLWAQAVTVSFEDLVGWDASPPGKVSLDWGDSWLNSAESALALVPSIVVPEEFCVLINPRHAKAERISARKVRRWTYDSRIKE